MKNLEGAINGVNLHTCKALGEIKQTSCWHPSVHALTDDAGRPLQYPNRAGQQSCRHGEGGWRGRSAGLVIPKEHGEIHAASRETCSRR